jgi:2-polyprenyl-3-methyl-5-hydroxy-6-metoxy-1,4-benzoquinol methylase
MDRLIKRFDCVRDADLRICERHGVAYQRDMRAARVAYDDSYFDRYKSYEGSTIEQALNAGRCAMLARHVEKGASVIDIGAGSGAFVRKAQAAGYQARGFDVIPKTVSQLRDADAYAEDPGLFDVVTFWDSIEHIDCPEILLREIRANALVLVAIPVFTDLRAIRDSKHYRPGEHLYYWTVEGFVNWMALYGFRLLEQSSHETDAGRESIGAFAFRRDLPTYHDHIEAYQEIHATRHYGSSATELHLQTVAKVVRELQPRSILDYGCGRSDIVAHFWLDGARRIERHDPAIPALKKMPVGQFDLVLCCDVMEHIPMASVDRVLAEIRTKGARALFTISLKLARARLPDGRNAHVTLLTADEWKRLIGDVFGSAKVLPQRYEHELIVLAGPKEGAT